MVMKLQRNLTSGESSVREDIFEVVEGDDKDECRKNPKEYKENKGDVFDMEVSLNIEDISNESNSFD